MAKYFGYRTFFAGKCGTTPVQLLPCVLPTYSAFAIFPLDELSYRGNYRLRNCSTVKPSVSYFLGDLKRSLLLTIFYKPRGQGEVGGWLVKCPQLSTQGR